MRSFLQKFQELLKSHANSMLLTGASLEKYFSRGIMTFLLFVLGLIHDFDIYKEQMRRNRVA